MVVGRHFSPLLLSSFLYPFVAFLPLSSADEISCLLAGSFKFHGKVNKLSCEEMVLIRTAPRPRFLPGTSLKISTFRACLACILPRTRCSSDALIRQHLTLNLSTEAVLECHIY